MHFLQNVRSSLFLHCIIIALVSATVTGCQSEVSVDQQEPSILKADGQTMGTYYAVTIADPPEGFPEDWAIMVDSELRKVNDQMSTYIKTSEVSRFNQSESTDWFEVSPETAMVINAAQEISRTTDGAFDITVGPLVNIWNFGPTKRTKEPPSAELVAETQASIGYGNLDVRLDPPAIKKSLPNLQVDLSAIAKGHGVDRIVELLKSHGVQNAFVDIGGEDRAMGRRGDRSWRVAIEDPNDQERIYHLAFELNNKAIATSGDYRNFFEYKGERYSHTIDPRTGRPVTNHVASVSVFATDCMTADGWATAITVLGPEEGVKIANQQGLAVRIVSRNEDGTFSVVDSASFPEAIETNLGGE